MTTYLALQYSELKKANQDVRALDFSRVFMQTPPQRMSPRGDNRATIHQFM